MKIIDVTSLLTSLEKLVYQLELEFRNSVDPSVDQAKLLSLFKKITSVTIGENFDEVPSGEEKPTNNIGVDQTNQQSFEEQWNNLHSQLSDIQDEEALLRIKRLESLQFLIENTFFTERNLTLLFAIPLHHFANIKPAFELLSDQQSEQSCHGGCHAYTIKVLGENLPKHYFLGKILKHPETAYLRTQVLIWLHTHDLLTRNNIFKVFNLTKAELQLLAALQKRKLPEEVIVEFDNGITPSIFENIHKIDSLGEIKPSDEPTIPVDDKEAHRNIAKDICNNVCAKDIDYTFWLLARPQAFNKLPETYPKLGISHYAVKMITQFSIKKDNDFYIKICDAIAWLTQLGLATKENIDFVREHLAAIDLLSAFKIDAENIPFEVAKQLGLYLLQLLKPFMQLRQQEYNKAHEVIPVKKQLTLMQEMLDEMIVIANAFDNHPEQNRLSLALATALSKINTYYLNERGHRSAFKYRLEAKLAHYRFEKTKQEALTKGELFLAEEGDNHLVSPAELKHKQQQFLKAYQLHEEKPVEYPLMLADSVDKIESNWKILRDHGTNDDEEIKLKFTTINLMHSLLKIRMFNSIYINKIAALSAAEITEVKAGLAHLTYGQWNELSKIKYPAVLAKDVELLFSNSKSASTIARTILWLNHFNILTDSNRELMLQIPANNLAKLELLDAFNHCHRGAMQKEAQQIFENLISLSECKDKYENEEVALELDSPLKLNVSTLKQIFAILNEANAANDNNKYKNVNNMSEFLAKLDNTRNEVNARLLANEQNEFITFNINEINDLLEFFNWLYPVRFGRLDSSRQLLWDKLSTLISSLFEKDRFEFICKLWEREHANRYVQSKVGYLVALKFDPQHFDKLLIYINRLAMSPTFTIFMPRSLQLRDVTFLEILTLDSIIDQPHHILTEATEVIKWLAYFRLATKERLAEVVKYPLSFKLLTTFNIKSKSSDYGFEKTENPEENLAILTFSHYLYNTLFPLIQKYKPTQTAEAKEDVPPPAPGYHYKKDLSPKKYYGFGFNPQDPLYTYELIANLKEEKECDFVLNDAEQKSVLTFTDKVEPESCKIIFVNALYAIIDIKELNDRQIKFFDLKNQECFKTIVGNYSKIIYDKLLDDHSFAYYSEDKLFCYDFIKREETLLAENLGRVDSVAGLFSNYCVVTSYKNFTLISLQDHHKIVATDNCSGFLNVDDNKFIYIKSISNRMPTDSYHRTYSWAKMIIHLCEFNPNDRTINKLQRWVIGHSPKDLQLSKENILFYQDLNQLYAIDLNDPNAEPRSLMATYNKFKVIDNQLYVFQNKSNFLQYDLTRLPDFLRNTNDDLDSQLKTSGLIDIFDPETTKDTPIEDLSPIAIWNRKIKLMEKAQTPRITLVSSVWHKQTKPEITVEDATAGIQQKLALQR